MSSKPKEVSRREFLVRSTQTAAGIVAAGALASCSTAETTPAAKSGVLGSNERINIAVIGIRSRGNGLTKSFAKISDVRVKTLVDVDENLFAERVKQVEEIQGTAPSTEYDLRRVFDDKDIDAVVIAAPNHWHALATIWACQASKDVYVEKPCSHNIWEGQRMIEAARKYGRIVQVGFQSRSNRQVREAMKFLQDGKLGEIYMTKGLCFKPRDSIGIYPDGPVPAGEDFYLNVTKRKMPTYDTSYLSRVHYDLWQGPAAKRPFNRNRFHYNWHWQWDYGNGDIGNQGPHQFDIARWALNKTEHPVKVKSTGGYFAFKNSAQETANTQTATFEYADGKILQFEVRGVYTNAEAGVKIGNLFFGTEGWMRIGSEDAGGAWQTFFGRKNEPGPSAGSSEAVAADPMNLAGAGEEPHLENFIRAVRSRKIEDLTCDIEVGHMSAVLPHMANISYRLGRELEFDGAREKFVGDKEANRMLKRKYRDPYVVPKSV